MKNSLAQSVLLVDDSQDIHRLVGARLRSEQVQLLHAFDAAQGLALARENQPDLVLLDLDMPSADGMTVCAQLKADPELNPIPVIFLTGTLDVETKVRAFELGAADYVTKPFDAVELKARVRAALRTKRYHDLLTTKAQIDALTGLWNRGYLNDRLAAELATLHRSGTPVCLVLVDIDHFKSINDRYGHPFGDIVLQRLAEEFSRTSRPNTVVCRYGGEEFAILLSNTVQDDALEYARRLCREVDGLQLHYGSQVIGITASFGLAGSDRIAGRPLDAQVLLRATDQALYRAKAAGRNRVVAHDDAGQRRDVDA